MATKFQIITAVYEGEINNVTKNYDNWTSFLRTAANNYKYSFPDQLLIYAQKPNATACAEIGYWNEKFDRWVNRGASGIALFDYKSSYQKLRYVFDISDTNSRNNIEVPIWQMKPEYEKEVIEALTNAFGEPMSDGNLAWIIEETAKNIVADQGVDYVSALSDIKAGSLFEELDDLNIEKFLKDTLSASVGYMMMSRCGINPDEHYQREDFEHLYSFDTHGTVTLLCLAVSSMAKTGLREIESTVWQLEKSADKQNRTFVKSQENDYDKGAKTKTETERSDNDGKDNLQTGGRLYDTEPHSAERGKRYSWQVWTDEERVSDEPQGSDVQHSLDEGRADEASFGSSSTSREDDGADNLTDGTDRGSDRGIESEQSAPLGANDEQYSTLSGGDSLERNSLRISEHDFDASGNGIDYFHQDKEKNELIREYLKPYKDEIASFYESHSDRQERSDFLMSFFTSEPFEIVLSNGINAGFEAYSDAVYFWCGAKGKPLNEAWERWFQVANAVYGMILLEEWTEPNALLLPTHEEQLEIIKAKDGYVQFTIPQAAIDYVLGVGSGFSEGKMRIYKQFTKSLSKDDNIRFLKGEYGTGGHSDAIPESGYWENHDASGIEIQDYYSEPKRKMLLSWSQVEKRISELIKLERYLNPKEKERYPQWLEKQEELRIERAIEAKNRKILATAPQEQPKEYTYEYHLGDTVYIGADEYSIQSVGADTVVLHDERFPIFTKEFAREDFDNKVKENPANDHLRVVVGDNKDVAIAEEAANPSVYDRETEILSDIFSALKLDDLEISFKDDEMLVADSDNNVWRGNEIYSFLIEDAFVFNDDGTVLGIRNDLLADFKALCEHNGVEFKDNRYNPLYRGYLEVKNENADKIVLYQVGDFFEAFNEDADVVANALDLVNTTRPISDNQRANMVGFPKHSLETYLNMLTDRGHDIVLSSLENGERISKTLVSTNKEDPIESKPVGRIDYLHTDGKVRESIEYTSEYQFAKDIKEENNYGVPMSVYVYKDKDGNSIDSSFISSLDPPLQGFDVIPSPYITPEKAFDESNITGKEITIDGSKFRIESISKFGDVSMLDLSAFYPINRVEKIDFVRKFLEPQKEYTTEFTDVLTSDSTGLPYDVVFEKLSFDEPKKETSLLKPEVPDAEKHDYRITDDNLGVGGLKEKFRNNIAAINLLHELEFDNRLATPEEQEILSKYVGFGGLSDAFDETKDSWKNEFTELYTTLSPEEYASARESTLTAFYTPPVVIRAMYQALENMGFKTGNILEPSCGVGNFIGMKPNSMADSKIYGVELDGLTGRIAQQLYQKSNIAVQGYETTDLPDSFFDVAIGNVPFGQFSVNDRKYNKNNWLIHDYFFGKTLDKVRPGGVIAFITSSGTMDKANSNVRRYIAQRADLLGAIRLPNNTFKANAGTEVVSDIIFLQKRDTLTNEEPAWVYTGKNDNGFTLNQYFIDNPDMVLGELAMESGPFGQQLTCKPYENLDLSALLNYAIQNIHAQIKEYDIDETDISVDTSLPADPSVRNFSYTEIDGNIYYRSNSRMELKEMSDTAKNRVRGMIAIRDAVRELIRYQTDDYPDSAIKTAQNKLNAVYDNYTKKYGLLNDRANKSVFSEDSSYCLLCSLEIIDENGKLKRKADMFTKRTIKPHIKVTSVDTPSEALAVSIGERACVDMEYMSELTGKSEQELFEALKGVIFLNPMYEYGNHPESKYLMADEYLSGNVREKLVVAKKSAELYPDDYSVNVEALQKVQPTKLSASEISVRLGATWLPVEDVERFIFELLQTPRYVQWNVKVHYSPYTSEWNIENKSYDRTNVIANTTYGTDRINAYKIIEETLNLKDVRIFDYVEDSEGNRKPVLNKKETAIAQGKQELIKQAFVDWIWKDPERRQRLVKSYNEKFNSMRAREFDGSHIVFSGMNPEITLRTHQRNAVARIMYGGNTLLAHVVGAGKTFEIVAAAQESKRLGLCNKSLIVVPNHLTEQWASEYLQLYPSANILVATKKDFETKNRKKFCSRIATGDYDAVIIGHSQFEKIPLSFERQTQMLQSQIDEITDGIADIKHNRGERFTVKQLEKTRKSLQSKLDKLNDQSRKDDVITFEELGVDRLFVDEAHFYKNLFLYTKMRNVGGIAQTEAQKSSDLYMKCRYLDEITENKGTVFATGTPVSNSMTELYTMQRYLQYDTLKEKGLQHFDAWASTFGETVTAIELAPEGTGYRAKTRFAKFYNLPELMMMFRQVADIQTADMLKLPVPEAIRKNIAIEPSAIQKDIVASLADRAEKVRNKMVDSSVDNMLVITNDGRKLALDQRLTNEMLPDDPNGKVSVCANTVFDIWEKTSEKKSAQLIFCDLSTPHNDGKFNVYDDIKKKLLAKGIPESEIAFIHSAETEAKKKELFSKVRSGQVRVLIGSTFKMGAGTNVQQKLIAEHHLDCPWRPADLQQREGRIIRQGNENPQVEIYTYVTKETFDSYLYQLVENKQKFIGQIMTSKSPVRSAEDVDEQALSYAEIKALATGNPYIKEKMDLDVAVSKLKLLKQNHLSQKYALEDKLLKYYPAEVKRLESRIVGYENDIKRAEHNTVLSADDFSTMVIEDVAYTEKKGAGSAILAACKAMTSTEPKNIGSYRGFDLELSYERFEKQYIITLVGDLRHSTPLGPDVLGNITRIDNLISKFPERLELTKESLANTNTQIENAQVQVDTPFSQEEELTKKSERLAELNSLLDMDHRDNEIVDGEIENGEPEKEKNRDLER